MKEYKVGIKVPIWWSTAEDGMGTVIAIRPYTGIYKDLFRYILKFPAATRSGTLEMTVE